MDNCNKFKKTQNKKTNFAKISEVFGGTGIRVERLSELDSAIKDTIKSDGFNLVDVVVDPMELLPPNSC